MLRTVLAPIIVISEPGLLLEGRDVSRSDRRQGWRCVGLLGVHSRYGLHTRAVTVFRDTLTEGFSHFVTSIAPRLLPAGAFAGWDLHPLESAALARRTAISDIAWPQMKPATTLCNVRATRE